jgi:protein TonB
MFEQTFVQTQERVRKPWSLAVSLSVQCLAVAVLLAIPLLHTETLRLPDAPPAHLIRAWISQPPLPPRKANSRTAAVSTPARRPIFVLPNTHTNAARTIETPDVPSGEPEAVWSGPPSTGFGTPLANTTALPPGIEVQKPAVQPPARPVESGPLKVGGDVEGAKLIFGPRPVYPALGKAVRSQGTVKLEAVIAADGSIRNLRVVSGPPLLVNAAIEAVRQWKYQPTLLNGVAVEVLTEIEVNFSLSN